MIIRSPSKTRHKEVIKIIWACMNPDSRYCFNCVFSTQKDLKAMPVFFSQVLIIQDCEAVDSHPLQISSFFSWVIRMRSHNPHLGRQHGREGCQVVMGSPLPWGSRCPRFFPQSLHREIFISSPSFGGGGLFWFFTLKKCHLSIWFCSDHFYVVIRSDIKSNANTNFYSTPHEQTPKRSRNQNKCGEKR